MGQKRIRRNHKRIQIPKARTCFATSKAVKQLAMYHLALENLMLKNWTIVWKIIQPNSSHFLSESGPVRNHLKKILHQCQRIVEAVMVGHEGPHLQSQCHRVGLFLHNVLAAQKSLFLADLAPTILGIQR